jgi:hypothetical protein
MKKDFVEIANDSGTNNGSFDVVCEQNSGNERSTILTVSGGGVTKTVNINQKKGISIAVIVGQNGNIFKIQLE